MKKNEILAHEKERRLYDTFDEQGIWIGISCAFWRSKLLFQYEIIQQGEDIIHGEILHSRHEAEAAAFNKAYEIIDYDKLN